MTDQQNRNEFELDLSDKIEEFNKYLEAPDSQRVIFSGPFGSGKTYFLNTFFRESEHKSKYRTIHLYPVNYSVSSNKDIFELIKFNILFEILEKFQGELEFDKDEVGNWLRLEMALGNNAHNIVTSLMSTAAIVGYGNDLASGLQGLLNAGKEVFGKFSENKDEDDDFEMAIKYLGEFKNKKGLPTEENHLTILITSLIEQLKDEGKYETVLIIDDLDRMDPDHIFRILNVFAAHFDVVNYQDASTEKSEGSSSDQDADSENGLQSYDNKFGFDKVIFSCDLLNIRRIFSARYGQDVDFSGYIDKFYTKEVFEFDLYQEFKEVVSKTLLPEISSDLSFNYILGLNGYNNNHHFATASILELFFGYSSLTTRHIKKLYDKKSIDFKNNEFKTVRNKTYQWKSFYPLILFQLLEELFGDINHLERAIKLGVKNHNSPDQKIQFSISPSGIAYRMLPLKAVYENGDLLVEEYSETDNMQGPFKFISYNSYGQRNGDLHYKVKRSRTPFNGESFNEYFPVWSDYETDKDFRVNIFQLIQDAFKAYKIIREEKISIG